MHAFRNLFGGRDQEKCLFQPRDAAIIIDMRRPLLSAMRPKSQLPIGRIRKPAAKTPAAFRSCVVWSPEGKNSDAK